MVSLFIKYVVIARKVVNIVSRRILFYTNLCHDLFALGEHIRKYCTLKLTWNIILLSKIKWLIHLSYFVMTGISGSFLKNCFCIITVFISTFIWTYKISVVIPTCKHDFDGFVWPFNGFIKYVALHCT